MKLGKLKPKRYKKTLLLAHYIQPGHLPPNPVSFGWSRGIAPDGWGMDANDTVGDCTCAGVAHLIKAWCNANGITIDPNDAEVLAFYRAITGYDPSKTDDEGNNDTDTGAACEDVLDYLQKHGISIDGTVHKIDAYAACEPGNINHIKSCVEIFGSCYIGIDLPASAMTQKMWMIDPSADNTIEGGHCVIITDYDAHFVKVISWGQQYYATWAWIEKYMDEAYACISIQDFIVKDKTPAGFALENLIADAKLLGNDNMANAEAMVKSDDEIILGDLPGNYFLKHKNQKTK